MKYSLALEKRNAIRNRGSARRTEVVVVDERNAQIHDHIAALIDEARGERLAHAEPTSRPSRPSRGAGLRRRAGRALMALGELVEGRAECESCPDGVATATGA
jgi:hypothetical protein